jgi:hypothetical protein
MRSIFFLLFAASAALNFGTSGASGQTPFSGTQWAPIKENMRELIGQGYVLSAVDGQALSQGAQSTVFYLSRKSELVRCSEAYGIPPNAATVFPCERLIAPVASSH